MTEENTINNHLCLCGCKQQTRSYRGKYNKFIAGHNLKLMIKTGSNHPKWNGGKCINSQGYIMIYSPNHPNKDHHNCVRQHRLIYENYLSIIFDEDIYITKGYEIHHINKQVDDNRLINLELLTHKEHKFKHRWDKSNRLCVMCNSKTTISKSGHEYWYKYEDGFICNNCFNNTPKRLEYMKIYRSLHKHYKQNIGVL